jgi:autocrine motility factor receptor
MPVILLDRLPLPSLQAYTIISIVLLSCSVYYAVQITSDPDWKVNSTTSRSNLEPNENESGESVLPPANFHHNETMGYHLSQLVTFMIQEPLCIWVSSCKVNGLLDCVNNVGLYDMVAMYICSQNCSVMFCS